MSGLRFFKPRPAQYVENGHKSALRKGTVFLFDAAIPDLAAAAVKEVRFTTGDSAIVFESGDIVINQEQVLLEVYEDVTFSAGGTLTTALIRNMNRLINIASEIVTYIDPTVDTVGELVTHQIAVGVAGQNINQPGFGTGAQDASFILKPNTEHVFRVTNQSILAVTIEAHYYFHEVAAIQYS